MPLGGVIFSATGSGRSRIRGSAPSLKYVLEGEELYRINGRSFRLRAGSFLLVEAGADVEAGSRGADMTIGLCVYLPSAAIDEAGTRSLEDIPGGTLMGTAQAPLAGLLRHYATLLHCAPETGGLLARRILEEVTQGAQNYLSVCARHIERLSAVKPSTRYEVLRRVELARSYLHDNAERSVTLEEISRFATLSRFHLSRSFVAVVGVPPLTYHRRLRLRRAARLLELDLAPVGSVASQLGYSSPSEFGRVFSAAFGCSPAQYRASRRAIR
jgi:AraC family transcriptional regulator